MLPLVRSCLARKRVVGAGDDVDDGVADSQHVEGSGCHEISKRCMPGLVSSSRVTMPATVKGTSARKLRTVDGERTQSHLAHDETHAKLDAGLQQRLEVADAALPVEGIALPVVERRRRAHQGANAGHGEEQHGGLVDRDSGTRHRQRIVHVLVLAGAHDDREATPVIISLMGAPQVGQSARLAIAISSNERRERVVHQQPARQRPADAEDFLHHFGGLHRAQRARERAQHARLRAARHGVFRRRGGKDAAQAGMARAVESLVGRDLAVEAQDRRRDQGLLQAKAGVVHQIARREVVAAVGHDVVGRDDLSAFAGVRRSLWPALSLRD